MQNKKYTSTPTFEEWAARRISSKLQPLADSIINEDQSHTLINEAANKESEMFSSNYRKKTDEFKSRENKTESLDFYSSLQTSEDFMIHGDLIQQPLSSIPINKAAGKEKETFSSNFRKQALESKEIKKCKHDEYKPPEVFPLTDAIIKKAASPGEKHIISTSYNKISDEINSQDFKNLEKLSHNFKEMYIKKRNSDLTISVKEHEFKAHKVILSARSSVFDAMFSRGLSESKSGIIPIDDCEPEVFEEFLFYIYSGRTNLSCDNACEMYYLADKYDMPDLKENCIEFLKKSLSNEIICDVVCLSTKHNEKDLLSLAIIYFARHMEEIIVTVKWQIFLNENPTKANELTIKALKVGYTKRQF